MDQSAEKPNPDLLKSAVHEHKATSKRGILERLFTFSFRGFVYPQIWEDPEVDINALKIDNSTRIMTIASGGCNVMNYLTEGPERVKAIDLNPAHVALTRLKIAAIKHLPDYESFFVFFGHADDKRNIENYDKYIAPHLDSFSREYWEKWTLLRGRRINYFTKNLYQFGLLGRFISAVHILAKIYGEDPREILNAKTMEEQGEIFDRTLGPIFDKPFVRWICNMPPALYGLGIPPAQFDELKGEYEMADVLKARLRRLACDFPIEDNYFAWQAFGRGYDREKKVGVPRYLSKKNYEELKKHADKVEVHHTTITGFLQSQPVESLDCYVFLDAQDWMNPDQLTELWREVARTARPGARVIFRTAGDESPLEEDLPADLLGKFHYDPSLSPEAVKKDRSSIYGGFHVYTLGGEVGAQKAKSGKAA
ncbi:MAG: S-adenosylmethionine--diacylglycerol 3-amino-3-carboxypropyl transferase [Micavibrio sp. TMED27]|mgnify:CR=1 FL=1|nr:S-adenosylmethionine--diacylglycerol 3-amino-3-carboxypropyl transferase [Micavibrio sp.]OUT91841.1 MAG: S-adenosylmethionine--diacylglycerol 3-amino-3-carboxypropyl transferase [Micavibrio sp. TMED27]|tara:strand:+ start:1458 stop:2726 length:1269 start_codon:yes stop_codon:yes gene_type:complete